jgi:Xaa-Pro aminopeptidase
MALKREASPRSPSIVRSVAEAPPSGSRRYMIRRALAMNGLNGLVCALPANVLMLTGYWPVVGCSLALVNREGRTAILAPDDEGEFAKDGRADVVRLFEAGSLDEIRSTIEIVRPLLLDVIGILGLSDGDIGCETGRMHEPSSYVSMFLYGGRLREMLDDLHDLGQVRDADEMLERLRSVKTLDELRVIRIACDIAARAFRRGRSTLTPGQREPSAAAAFTAPLTEEGIGRAGIERAGGAMFAMSGPNSARAYGAYARTRNRTLAEGDLVMVHCNSYAEGYWTDITRTYCLGRLDDRKRKIYRAVLDARHAALSRIRPGARGAEVDAAARRVIAEHGFDGKMKHPTGHGVGFAAIDHLARPLLHPLSTDVLEVGMVFNVEPAVYLEGYGGIRHCDVVAVTEDGVSVLTPFHATLDELVLG